MIQVQQPQMAPKLLEIPVLISEHRFAQGLNERAMSECALLVESSGCRRVQVFARAVVKLSGVLWSAHRNSCAMQVGVGEVARLAASAGLERDRRELPFRDGDASLKMT